jgi:hypothetical protein
MNSGPPPACGPSLRASAGAWRWLFRGLLGVHVALCLALAAGLLLSVYETRSALEPPADAGGFLVLHEGRVHVAEPSLVPASFPAVKAAGELRIYVLGGSMAMGSPFVVQGRGAGEELFGLLGIPNEGGISTWIEAYLQAAAPDRPIRVVNAAAGGRDSAVVLTILEEILAVGEPDLLLVLSGNNETEPSKLDRDGFRLLPGHDVDELSSALGERFGARLGAMVAASAQAQVPLWVLTVPSNLEDWEPLDDDRVERGEVEAWLRDGEQEACVERLQALGPGDNARVAWELGRCLQAAGRGEEALGWYRMARDRDRMFLRARSSWNDRVRALDGRPGVRVVDLEAWLEARSLDGIPGHGEFVDACHMSIATNRRVGRMLAGELASAMLGTAPGALGDLEVPGPTARVLRRLLWLQRIKAARIRFAAWLQGEEVPQWQVDQQLQLALGPLSQVEQAWREVEQER